MPNVQRKNPSKNQKLIHPQAEYSKLDYIRQAQAIAARRIQVHPDRPEGYIQWIKTTRNLGEFRDAEMCLDYARNLFPNNTHIQAIWIKWPIWSGASERSLAEAEKRYNVVVRTLNDNFIHTIGASIAFQRNRTQEASTRINRIPANQLCYKTQSLRRAIRANLSNGSSLRY